MDNNEKYTALYRGAIQPNKVYAVKHFLYRSLNFEKHDIQLRKAFKEFICSEAYLRFIKNLHLPFYPDHLNYQLSKLLNLKFSTKSPQKQLFTQNFRLI